MIFSDFFSFTFILLILHFGVGKAFNCRGPLKTITVSQSGKAQFKSIQGAIDSVSNNNTQNTQWIRIKISSGVYRQDLTFVEEGCWGPGSNKSKRVPWMKHLSQSTLHKFVDTTFIDQEGWISKLPIKPS